MLKKLAILICVCIAATTVKSNDIIDTTKFKGYELGEKIRILHDSIVAANKYVEKLDTSTFYNLPVGVTGGAEKDPAYALLINDAVITEKGGTFTAYMSLTNPFDGSKLAFEAQNVPFSFKGGLIGDIRLVLVTEQKFTICKDVDLRILPGTYVEWDCNGFKRLKIKGEVEFSSKTFLPANDKGELLNNNSRLTAFIETEVKSLNDLTLTFSITPFQIKGVPDITFSCTNLAVDYSDFTNPEAVKFPTNYLSSFPGGMETLWRGIYVENATVILGPKFRKKADKAPTTFAANNLIIDEQGFTGMLSATNILTIENGDLGGWEFSIKTLSAEFLANKLTSASFGGDVHIPVFKDGSNLTYNAIIDLEGKYSFTVSPTDSLEFSVLGSSKLVLYKNSFVNVTVEDGKFIPTAVLTGNLSINAPFSANSKTSLKLANVEFQEMRISTQDPVFNVKYIAISGKTQGAFSGFPVSIDKINCRTISAAARFSINLKINLVPSGDDGFKGETTIVLVAKRNGLKFKYEGIEIDKIRVDIVKANAFEIHGGIAFAKEDPVFGNGFRGDIDAKFGKIEIEAVAIFGRVNGFRYFFVDGFLAMKPGIPAGMMNFYGFGGGLYYHMKQKPGSIDPNSMGASRSGVVYEPNEKIGYGIMASVKFCVVSEKIIDAEAKFEIVFNASGGLNRIAFFGGAKCIVPGVDIVPDKIKAAAQKLAGDEKLDFKPTDAALAVTLMMEMDFEHDVFHAELEAFVNVGPIIKGIGDQGSAGKCVLHIEPKKWYLHVGTQTNPLGMKFLGFIKVGGYFMVGHDIPTDLPLNPTLAEILNITPSKAAANRDNNKLATGKGIAFGAGFDINTGDLTFLIFYASFQVGAGFDILLVNYPKEAYCKGSTPPIGINGWYAKGQAYAYLKGEIGIKIKIFGIRKKFEILSIAAAALLRAEAPNPLYLEGQAGGRFRLLGGLISGECKFKVTYGEKCEAVMPTKESPLADIKMIGSITPKDKNKDVDVFVLPQGVFNIPINKEFNISDNNNTNHKFRSNLDKLTFTKDGQPVPGSIKWNEDNTVAIFEPADILYPDANYVIDIQISFEENIKGKWVISTDEEGKKIIENQTCTFTTGELPKEIPAHLIAYNYPLNRQYNFYPKEYNEGYIAFNLGIAPYFNPGAQWKQEVRFVPVGKGKPISTSLSYNSISKTVTFPIPENIDLNRIYHIELTNVPTGSTDINRNVTETVQKNAMEEENSMEVRTREASETISAAEEFAFLSYAFRTSKFKTFGEKLSLSEIKVNMLYDISPYVYFLQGTIYGTEMFDKYEIYGENGNASLIRRTANLQETPWYLQAVAPVVYKNYPIEGKAIINWRNPAELGVPPKGDIKIWQLNFDHTLSDDEIETGIATSVSTWAHFMYALPYYWSKDYYDIRMRLANIYPTLTSPNQHINSILNKVIWPVVDKGNYPVTFEYILPGINKVTTTKTITFSNPFSIVQPTL
jgi:hypothetical protein